MAIGANNFTCGKGEDFKPQIIVGSRILSSSVANPSVIKTRDPHGLQTGDAVWIINHTGSTPSINSANSAATVVVTVIDATSFSIPTNVTIGGTGGTVSKDVYDITGYVIQGFVKAVDTAASPLLTVSCNILGSAPTVTFETPFTSANTQTLLTSTTYLQEQRRTDAGFNTLYNQGNFTILTEREYQTP